MSIAASQLVWGHSRAKGAALLVLLSIADYTNQDGIAYPGLERLAEQARINVRHVLRCLESLKKLGELTITSRGGRHKQNVYRIAISPERGLDNRDTRMSPNPLGTGGEKRKTNTAARSQSSRAGVRTDSNPPRKTWGDGCPEFPIDREMIRRESEPVRIDVAGSPKPRVPKHEPPPDPLMQARKKPESAAPPPPQAKVAGLFGGEEPESVADEIVVREAFQAAYTAKYGVLANWTGAESRQAKDLMRMVREAAAKRRADPERVLARLCTTFIADSDGFLAKNAHRFLLLGQRAPRYLSETLGLGKGTQFESGSW